MVQTHCCLFKSSMLLLFIFLCHRTETIPVQVLFERANVTFMNPKYVDSVTMNVRRANRKSPYAVNIEGTTKHTWTDNVTIHFVFMEYLHNEYRPSFVELHKSLCNLINKEPFIGPMLKKAGLVCPLPPGHYKLSNMTPSMSSFPNIFPFKKGRIDITVDLNNGDKIAQGWIEATFKQVESYFRRN